MKLLIQNGRVIDPAIGQVACGVAGHFEHPPVQTASGQALAIDQGGEGHGQGLHGRAEYARARGLHQLGQAAGVIGVVVRD